MNLWFTGSMFSFGYLLCVVGLLVAKWKWSAFPLLLFFSSFWEFEGC